MAPTFAEQITAILTMFTSVLTTLLSGIADVATFATEQPLIVISIVMSLVAFSIYAVRRRIRS